MLLDRLHAFKSRPLLAWPLIAANLVAVWYGWTEYYAGQFARTEQTLWVFVPDSPNAVLLFALALILHQLFQWRHPLLDALAWVANVKVGIWTVFVLVYYYDGFFDEDPALRWALLWLHVGMVAQAFVLHRDLNAERVPTWLIAVVTAWFLAGDAVDYGLGVHPSLPDPDFPAVVATVTVLLSVACVAVLAWLYAAARRPHRSENL